MTSQALPDTSRARATLLAEAVRTDGSLAPLCLRATLAVALFPHGAQKALGWFGGYGWDGTMGFYTGRTRLPRPSRRW